MPNTPVIKTIFQKLHVDINVQLEQLKSKHLCCDIDNDAYYHNILKNVGYYRFSGYAYPFRQPQNDNLYIRDTTIDDIYKIYQFDKKLRALTLEAIALIEISIRSNVIYVIGSKLPSKPHEYLRNTLFTTEFKTCEVDKNQSSYEYISNTISHKIDKSKKYCITHFRSKYEIEQIPIWISAEIWGFGDLCVYTSGLNKRLCKAVMRNYNLSEVNFFKNNLLPLKEVRNICAHHDRLWNITLPDHSLMLAPNTNQKIKLIEHVFGNKSNDAKLYSVLTYIQFLLLKIDKESKWHERLIELTDDFPEIDNISIRQMGFPENWRDQDIWK